MHLAHRPLSALLGERRRRIPAGPAKLGGAELGMGVLVRNSFKSDQTSGIWSVRLAGRRVERLGRLRYRQA